MMRAKVLFLFALLGLTGFAQQQRDPSPLGLAQGVIAGEVTETSAILQSRLTTTRPNIDFRWSGIPGRQGVAQFEYGTSRDLRGSQRTKWMEAVPETDFIVKVRVTGLQPATRCYYRLHYGENKLSLRASPVGSFRTHAGSSQPGTYRFAVVTGMNYSAFHYAGGPVYPAYGSSDKHLGYPGLEAIRKLKPDYFVGTGDNVYYDHPHVGRAETLQQMRMKHHEQYSQPRFVELFREAATYWIKDDHDYRFNDSDPVNPFLVPGKVSISADTYPKTNLWPTISGSGSQPSHELGIYVFREQLPVVDPHEKDPRTFRTHRVSRDLQVWLVEGRDYRSPNDMPDGPNKMIWGEEQKEWLKRTLLESDATFKILVSPTPLVGPDSVDKRDSHVNLRGFRHERNEFFHWLVKHGFVKKNFYILCGDRHWQYHAVDPSGIQEFSVGALVDANAAQGFKPGNPRSTDPKGTIKHLHFNEEPTGGFLILTVSSSEGPHRAVAEFAFYDECGSLLYKATKPAELP